MFFQRWVLVKCFPCLFGGLCVWGWLGLVFFFFSFFLRDFCDGFLKLRERPFLPGNAQHGVVSCSPTVPGGLNAPPAARFVGGCRTGLLHSISAFTSAFRAQRWSSVGFSPLTSLCDSKANHPSRNAFQCQKRCDLQNGGSAFSRADTFQYVYILCSTYAMLTSPPASSHVRR